ncbi:MAG: HetP family heterocyst commitment protein [Cyanobacteria bacterium P01_E01_bin.6]
MLGFDNNRRSKLYNAMTEQQFEEVVGAIVDGKYSWACMLILEFAGYNPLYYIPRRTYTRLKREHKRKDIAHAKTTGSIESQKSTSAFPFTEAKASQVHRTQIRDLTYLEGDESEKQTCQGRGIDISNTDLIEVEQEFDKIKHQHLKISDLIPLDLW